MPIAHSPYAPLNIDRPEVWAFCDRCNFQWLHKDLQWQFQWAGGALVNYHLLVCPRCIEVPNPGLKTIIIGPDPLPVRDARPGFQTVEEDSTTVPSIQEILGD